MLSEHRLKATCRLRNCSLQFVSLRAQRISPVFSFTPLFCIYVDRELGLPKETCPEHKPMHIAVTRGQLALTREKLDEKSANLLKSNMFFFDNINECSASKS